METYEKVCIMEAQAIPEVEKLIAKYKPKTYCEIGVHNGLTAAGLIMYMLKFNPDIHAELYDAFEPVDWRKEHNGKSDATEEHYKKCIKRMEGIRLQNLEFKYKIVKGYTQDTLKNKKYDFAYIDGGHSYDTVKHDYNKVLRSKIILFDDYNLTNVKRAVDEIGKGYRLPYETPNGKKKKWVIINDS